MQRASQPAVVINGAIAENFEILGQMPVFGLRIVKSIGHANALDWLLFNAIDNLRLG